MKLGELITKLEELRNKYILDDEEVFICGENDGASFHFEITDIYHHRNEVRLWGEK